jgi:membrane protease YdiL (CAAX protease family)
MYFALVIPYLAVLTGLYVFRSVYLAFGFYQAGMLIWLLIHRYRFRNLFLGWRWWGWIWIVIGLMAGIGLTIMFPDITSTFLPILLATGLREKDLPLFIIVFVLVTSTLEEPFWRDLLGQSRALISISDIAFGGYHLLVVGLFTPSTFWYWLPVIFICLTAMSAIWRRLRQMTQGLMIPWLSHAAADFSVMAWLYWQVS